MTTDPQWHIRQWMRLNLERMGRGSKKKLAELLGLSPDAVTRMINVGDQKEVRKIQAHELLTIEQFVGRPAPTLEEVLLWNEHGLQRAIATEAHYRKTGERSLKWNGIQVAGAIQAGNWLDTSLIDDRHEEFPETIPVAPDYRFEHARQYALEVKGDSMDKEYPEGSYVICVDFAESGLELKQDMIVHVERWRHDLREITLKLLKKEENGWRLEPRSNNPSHKAFHLNGEPIDDTEVYIRGVVIGDYRRRFV